MSHFVTKNVALLPWFELFIIDSDEISQNITKCDLNSKTGKVIFTFWKNLKKRLLFKRKRQCDLMCMWKLWWKNLPLSHQGAFSSCFSSLAYRFVIKAVLYEYICSTVFVGIDVCIKCIVTCLEGWWLEGILLYLLLCINLYWQKFDISDIKHTISLLGKEKYISHLFLKKNTKMKYSSWEESLIGNNIFSSLYNGIQFFSLFGLWKTFWVSLVGVGYKFWRYCLGVIHKSRTPGLTISI